MQKGSIAFDLMEMMEQDECPVCALLQKHTQMEIDYLLYENVNDPGVRTAFLASDGFCRHHANLMTEHGDPLGHAILYQNLLQVKLEQIEKSKRGTRLARCMLCEHEETNESAYLQTFVDLISNPEFTQKYASGGLLCLYHFGKVRSLLASAPYSVDGEAFQSVTIAKYRSLLHDLSEIQRKSDYRFTSEGWTESESRSWKRAVRLLIDQGEYHRHP